MVHSQENRYGKKKLFRWSVLVAIVHLLPHVEVVICPRIEFKGYAANMVEHDIRSLE